MDLRDIQRILNYFVGDRISKPVPPSMFEELLHDCSLSQLKKKIGLPEEYRPGMPIPRESYEINLRNSVDLAPFKVIKGGGLTTPMFINSNGYGHLPTDCYYPSSFTFLRYDDKLDPRPVDICSDAEFSERRGSSVKRPSFKYPICTLVNSSLVRFEPINLRMVDLTYIKVPRRPVFGYDTITGSVRYMESKSTQLEWDDLNTLDIIVIMLERLGVITNAADVAQYAQKINVKGI